MVTVGKIIEELEQIAPPELADSDDRIGLQTGDPLREAQRVCVSVDTLSPAVDRAIEAGADLLVAHHPLIYQPLTSLAETSPIPAQVARLVRANVALYVMHTNYDTVPGGVNDVLAARLGVTRTQPLTNRREDRFHKIAVFVPEEAVEKVRNAMAEAGAGRIGQYTHCSFRSPGTGSFVPLAAANPYIGTAGRLEEVPEFRLEMMCVGSWLDSVVAAMLESHPYDEVAYDVYELANEPVVYGYGRVGVLEAEMTLAEFAERVKTTLEVRWMKVAGDEGTTVKRVALCGGGGSFLYKEAAAGADVYVTGDTKHHDILEANALGLAMIDAGHFETEKPGMTALVDRLRALPFAKSLEIDYVE